MKLQKTIITLSLASFGLLASTLGAQTILNETWTGGNRDTQDLPRSAQWFTSSKGDQLTTAGGKLILSSETGTNYALAYFAPAGQPVKLAAGKALQISYNFQLATIAAKGTPWLRIGVFDSNAGGGRIDADGLGESNNTYKGYRGYLFDEANVRSGYSRLFRRKSSKKSGNLMTTAGKSTYTRLKEGSKSKWGGYQEGLRYSGTLTITHNSDDTVTITQSVRDPQGSPLYTVSATDKYKPYYFQFDTLVFALTKSSRGIALDNVKVEVTDIPQSSAPAALGALALTGALLASRKRSQRVRSRKSNLA